MNICILNDPFELQKFPTMSEFYSSSVFFILGVFHVFGFPMYKLDLLLILYMQQSIYLVKYTDWEENVSSSTAKAVISFTVSVTMQKGGRAETDTLSRTTISHAKSPGTGPRTLDAPLTLGCLQTKEQKSTNQWAFSPAGEGKGRCRGSWVQSRDGDEGDGWRLG